MKFTSITIAACALSVRTSQAVGIVQSSYSGPTTPTNSLEETGAAKINHVVMGTGIDPDTNEKIYFYATNATIAEAEKFRVGFTKSQECSDEALKNALITQVSEERRIVTNTPGANGWHMQSVTQIEDNETPSLNEFIDGADSNYTLVSYFYNLQKDLVACAHLKPHDEDTAAMYDELLEEVAAAKEAAAENADVAAAGVEAAANDTSSGSKSGLFAIVSVFAAVGIAVVMGDVLAL